MFFIDLFCILLDFWCLVFCFQGFKVILEVFSRDFKGLGDLLGDCLGLLLVCFYEFILCFSGVFSHRPYYYRLFFFGIIFNNIYIYI